MKVSAIGLAPSAQVSSAQSTPLLSRLQFVVKCVLRRASAGQQDQGAQQQEKKRSKRFKSDVHCDCLRDVLGAVETVDDHGSFMPFHPLQRFSVSEDDGGNRGGVGCLVGSAQGAVARGVAEIRAAQMVANTARQITQRGQGGRIARAIVHLDTIGLANGYRLVGQQHGLAGKLVPSAEVGGDFIGLFEMLEA